MIKNHITENCKAYNPVNTDKYKGEYPIICRSGWEYDLCRGLDLNSSILYGSSEPTFIPYFNPLKQRDARYYPDYLVKAKNKKGKEVVGLVEVKPYKECHPPVNKGKKKKKTLMGEEKTGKVNEAKGKAAKRFCKSRGGIFKIITERELYGKK